MQTFSQPRDFRWNEEALLAWSSVVTPPRPPKAVSKTPAPEPPGDGDDERAERFRPATPKVPGDLVSRGVDLLRRMLEFAELERRRGDKNRS